MPITSRRIFRPRPSATPHKLHPLDRIATSYRAQLRHHPFLLFGLPFLAVMVAGSFFLTPATALRYERHDRKVQQVSQSEAMGLGIGRDGVKREKVGGKFEAEGGSEGRSGSGRRPGTEKEEYYRLMAKDLDTWEQKRVERWKGEPDGRL